MINMFTDKFGLRVPCNDWISQIKKQKKNSNAGLTRGNSLLTKEL